jgi:carbonic anhydrase
MDRYQQVFENNKEWIKEKTSADKDYFKKMETGQQPDFLFIGCSDSRVPANEIMGLAPGEVFVHRNIANVVSNIDINVQSVIEYAVEHLHVKYIIFCGHYHCGGY